MKAGRDLINERFTRRLFGWLKFLSSQLSTGYFGIFTTAHRAFVPHFRFKKDLIFYSVLGFNTPQLAAH